MNSEETDAIGKPTRRAAAKKASRLAAEQLESSSEDESSGPSSGEPSKRKVQVTVTYRRKKKYTAKTDSAQPSPLPSSKRPTASSSLSQTASSTLEHSRERKQFTKPLSSKLSEAQYISSSSDSDIVILDGPPSPLKKAPRRKRSSLGQGESHRQSGVKKRKYSDSNPGSSTESHEGSLLTPLSSPPPEAGPAKSSGKRVASRDRTRHVGTRASPSREPSPTSLSPQYNRVAAPTSSRLFDNRYDTLDLDEDVVLVYIRLGSSGALSASGETMWWPAQVVDRGSPLRVTPFGKHPGWSSKEPYTELSPPSRSPEFILPYRSGQTQLRFDEKTFYSSGDTLDLATTPRKRRKTADLDLIARWCEARDLMLKAHQDAHDGMPLLLSRYIGELTSPRKPGLKRGASSISLDGSGDEDAAVGTSSFRSRAENILYDIPGELVLAKERRNETRYWPAKLMKFLPLTKADEKPRYEVLFFDGTVKKMHDHTDMFYTMMHDGFRTCKLGDAHDDYDINDGARDDENGVDLQTVHFEEEPDEKLRAASPSPPVPAPTAFGHELTIQEQFEYVKPVLIAILNGQHARGALQRHIAFMKGGRSRTQVSNSAWRRGEVSHHDRDELSRCVLRWMRRRQRRQELGFVPADDGVLVRDGGFPDGIEAGAQEATGNIDPEAFAGDTESTPSEVEMPPSSFVTSASTRADFESFDDAPRQDDMTLMDHSVDGIDVGEGASGEPNTHDGGTADEGRKDLTPAEPLPTYALLSPLDQITYCTSVLLPEAILQILLWRNGHRHSPELLSPDEEERLRKVAEENADATYWVHDIIHMKRSVDRKTLPSSAPVQPEASSSGRLRTRRR